MLGTEWLKQIEALKYDDPFTLPPDLELSVAGREAALAYLSPRLRIVVPATVVLILFTIS